MFKYQPRADTPFVDILYDTAMIERDFAKAEKQRTKNEAIAKMRALTAARNRRRR